MLKHRLPVGAALIALVLLVAWLDEVIEARTGRAGVMFFVVAAPVFALAARELAVMLDLVGVRLPKMLAPVSALAGLAAGAAGAVWGAEAPPSIIVAITAVWLAVTLVSVSWPKRTEGALAGAAGAMLAFLFLGLIPSHYLILRQANTAWTIIALLLIAKSCDIGAFFTGRSIGRHKLIPWLSPGKTWEGLAGGVATAALVAAGAAWVSPSFPGDALRFPLDPLRAAGLGAVLGLVAQFGDLSISLFKRNAGVKDASKTLPGLGGVLDVIDSLLFVAPAAHLLISALAAPEH